MVCQVCGKDEGVWANFGNHSQICKECTAQGQNQLKVLATSVGCVTTWNQQHADGWLALYDEIIHKYQVPPADATRARDEILNGIFKLVESQQPITDADVEYMAAQGHRYHMTRSECPELADTVFRIDLRQAIQSWDIGKPIEKQCTALVLAKGEICYWEEPAGLLVQRTQREYVGVYGSVRIGRVRVGGFKGVPIDKTMRDDGGTGVLHVTNQRVCFTGLAQAVAIPFAKIVSLAAFSNGFEVHPTNDKKPGIFLVPHPELTVELLNRASSSKGVDDSGPKRSKMVPSVA